MTVPDRALSFGIKTSQMGNSYEQILEVWREADQLPVFEHAWLWDHMVPLRGDIKGAALEAWTLLAALAAQTSRLRLGVIVTSNRLRSPTLLAKMAATATGSCASSTSTPTSGTTRECPPRSSGSGIRSSTSIAPPSDATAAKSSARCRRSSGATILRHRGPPAPSCSR